jgi:hypothetical protein
MMKYSLLIIALLLTACSTPAPEAIPKVVIQRTPIDRPALNLPPVDKFDATTVNWIIVTPENVDQIFAEISKNGAPPVLFAVTATGYENVAVNTQSSLRIILQQRAQISGYRQYYIVTDSSIKKYNTTITQEQ